MFCSGTEIKGLFTRNERRQVAWLAIVGTGLPFAIALLAAPVIPLQRVMGSTGRALPLVLIVGMALSVTSIPVISKILHDLEVLHTRFARLILTVAVMEDIVLWAVLAIAISLAKAGSIPDYTIAIHVAEVLVYFGLGLAVLPRLLQRFSDARWNVVARTSPVAYVFSVLLAYSAIAAALDISLVFAAFLAGYGITSGASRFEDASGIIAKFSFAVFVPIYFAIVGYRLDFTRTFSLTMLLAFLLIACAVKLFSAGLGARLAGFNWKDSLNLSMALNARGGPGIVLASVAFDAGIINSSFYTTLVLIAIVTSQMAGGWLDYVLHKDRRLLSEEAQKSCYALEPEPRVSA
jgi:Kef-type K+ transport system membrane component KefB